MSGAVAVHGHNLWLKVSPFGKAGVPVQLVDLKPQYSASKPSIMRRLEANLDHVSISSGPFSLPMYAHMDEATQQRIAREVRESLRQAA